MIRESYSLNKNVVSKKPKINNETDRVCVNCHVKYKGTKWTRWCSTCRNHLAFQTRYDPWVQGLCLNPRSKK